MNFGRLLVDHEIWQRNVFDEFDEYFNYPILTKISDKEHNSIYAVKIYCLLGKYKRYLIAITSLDNEPIGVKIPLGNISWISLQTREIEDDLTSETHSYTPTRKIFDEKIFVDKRTSVATIYKCNERRILVTILHKSNSEFECSNIVKINSALESYRTIVTFQS